MAEPETQKRRRWQPVVFAGLAVVGAFLIYWFLIVRFLPSWADRGLFGDAFGALNALMSSAALVAVVYTLYLQQKQLQEAKRAIELQQQPVVSVSIASLVIDKPAVFTAPGNPTCEALSRYRCCVTFTNLSGSPAVGAVGALSLSAEDGDDREQVRSIGTHVPFIAAPEAAIIEALLVPEKAALLFRALRKRDARSVPRLDIELVYRNVMGACFAVRRGFHLVATPDVEQDLRVWHTAIDSFGAKFQNELNRMAKGGFRQPDFDQIKVGFARETPGSDSISIRAVGIPGALYAAAVSEDYYKRFTARVGVPRLTFEDTPCLFED